MRCGGCSRWSPALNPDHPSRRTGSRQGACRLGDAAMGVPGELRPATTQTRRRQDRRHHGSFPPTLPLLSYRSLGSWTFSAPTIHLIRRCLRLRCGRDRGGTARDAVGLPIVDLRDNHGEGTNPLTLGVLGSWISVAGDIHPSSWGKTRAEMTFSMRLDEYRSKSPSCPSLQKVRTPR
jgi:hypothetical protein